MLNGEHDRVLMMSSKGFNEIVKS